MEENEKYMKEALRLAVQAEAEGEVPIGAVITCRGRIIGKGHNMTERLNDPTAHAEMIAITAATEWCSLDITSISSTTRAAEKPSASAG